MALLNRDKDQSEQREVYQVGLEPIVTGATYGVCIVPFPAQLLAAEVTGNGVSGAPNLSLWQQRFVVGAGVTSVAVGMSLVLTTFGTSGPQGFTVLQTGATTGFTNLFQAGDVILLSTAAANTAAADLNVAVVLKALQDTKTHFGV